jgi:hypothetical protein
MTKLLKCNCKNHYQDQKYGLGMRIVNSCLKPPGWRCTVCKTVHNKI